MPAHHRAHDAHLPFFSQVLEELLDSPKARDFGRDIIPHAIKQGKRVMAFHMDSFWDDIGGSIEDFYNLNIRLACDEVDFNFLVCAVCQCGKGVHLTQCELVGIEGLYNLSARLACDGVDLCAVCVVHKCGCCACSGRRLCS